MTKKYGVSNELLTMPENDFIDWLNECKKECAYVSGGMVCLARLEYENDRGTDYDKLKKLIEKILETDIINLRSILISMTRRESRLKNSDILKIVTELLKLKIQPKYHQKPY